MPPLDPTVAFETKELHAAADVLLRGSNGAIPSPYNYERAKPGRLG
jgi:hypothetical protein